MRRKSTTEKELAQAAAQQQQQSGFKKVRRTEEFLEAVKPDEQKPVINIPAREVIEDEADDLVDFLTELEEEIGLSLRVDRLPQYGANGKFGKGATIEFCDNIPISKGDLRNGAYMSMIRDLFGPAAYRCTLREVGAGIIKVWVIKIAAPIAQPQQRGAGGSSIIYQQQPTTELPPPRDTLKDFLESLKMVKEIREVISGDNGQVATPIIHPTMIEPPPLQDKIVSSLIDLVVKTEKPEAATQLLASYLNPKSDELSWKEIIGEVVKPMVPAFMGLLSAYMQNQARQQVMTQAQAGVTQNTQQALPPVQQPPPMQGDSAMFHQVPIPDTLQGSPNAITQPAQEPQRFDYGFQELSNSPSTFVQPQAEEPPLTQEEEEEMARDDLIYNLADMLEQCVRQAGSNPDVIAKGREEVLAYKKRFPAMSFFLDALYGMPPEVLIGLLAAKVPEVAQLIDNDVAKQAIRDFQVSLREPTVRQE